MPSAIKYGIPLSEFDSLSPKKMFMYQMDYEQKQLDKVRELENSAYIYGIYTKLAVGSILTNKCAFPKEPMHFFKNDINSEKANDIEKNERIAANEMRAWISCLKSQKSLNNPNNSGI